MDLERITRWQWALIGLCIGFALAASRSFYTPEYYGKSLDENFNIYAPGTAKQPVATLVVPGAWFISRNWFYLSDLVVHVPTRNNVESSATYWVTGVLHQVKPAINPQTGGFLKDGANWKFDSLTAEEFFHRARTPYKVGKAAYPNVMAYLNSLAAKDGIKRYRYAWWENSVAVWTLYPLAGLIAIGGAWPIVISLLIGAGLGRKRAVDATSNMPSTAAPQTAATPAQATEPIAPQKEFGGQRDQFYPTEIHLDPP